MSDQKVLDLQALFGQAQAVKVKTRDGNEHELLRMEAISPKEAVRFQKLQLRASKLQGVGENMNDAQAADLTKVFDDLLSILCKTLPLKDMQFMEKIYVIQFYMEQTQGKKKMDNALQKLRTGAKRSRK